MIQTLFYKTLQDFCNEYGLNFDYVLTHVFGECLFVPGVVGKTELDLLKRLDLVDSIGAIDEKDDPRSLVYILYIE